MSDDNSDDPNGGISPEEIYVFIKKTTDEGGMVVTYTPTPRILSYIDNLKIRHLYIPQLKNGFATTLFNWASTLTTLTYLNLIEPDIDDSRVQILCTCLSKSYSITEFVLNGFNYLTMTGCGILKNLYLVNTSIHKITTTINIVHGNELNQLGFNITLPNGNKYNIDAWLSNTEFYETGDKFHYKIPNGIRSAIIDSKRHITEHGDTKGIYLANCDFEANNVIFYLKQYPLIRALDLRNTNIHSYNSLESHKMIKTSQ